MWILPSRSRPKNITRLLAAFKETGGDTPVWLRLDGGDPMLGGYPRQSDLPWLWELSLGPRCPLSEIYAEAFQLFCGAEWFGFIADDVVPETQEWDRKLIEIAGTDGMAVPAGGHDPDGTPHFVLGGDLVRSVGWLSLPGLHRLYIDTVWADIARERGVLIRVPEVVLKHHHFSNKLALYDSIYRKPSKDKDKETYNAWRG